MEYILIATLCFFIFVGKLLHERVPVLVLYSSVWLAIILSCELHLQNQLPYDGGLVYTILILGIISFIAGYMIVRFGKIPTVTISKNYDSFIEYSLNQTVVNIILGIIAVFLVYESLKVLELFLSGVTFLEIRYQYYMKGLLLSDIENIILVWFVNPVINYCLIPINIIAWYQNDMKLNKKILFLSIIDAILKIFVTQGKENIIVYLLSLIVITYQYNLKRKKIFMGMVFLVILMFLHASYRSDEFNSLFLYSYIGIELNLLDNWIQYIDNMKISTNGLIYLSGILNVPLAIFRGIGVDFSSYYEAVKIANYINAEGVTVFPNEFLGTNVYVTCFTYFYLDFGVPGVVVGSLLFGIFLGNFSKLYILENNNHYIEFLYNILVVSALATFISWPYRTTSIVLAFGYVIIFFKRKKVG